VFGREIDAHGLMLREGRLEAGGDVWRASGLLTATADEAEAHPEAPTRDRQDDSKRQ
jgi:hypothetical protein